MKFLDEYRGVEEIKRLAKAMVPHCQEPRTLMEVCGGQTHSFMRFGLLDLLPEKLRIVHGPGCPVCVTPVDLIDHALEIARRPNVILTSFGDMLRVPGSGGDLLSAKAQGSDVKVVYSPLDAVNIAAETPDKEVVFFAVGFETTAPINAMAVSQAHTRGLKNFSILSSHVLVPPAMESILSDPDNVVQAFLAAGHVCTIMGTQEYHPLAERFRVPIVVTGFEPLDLMQGTYMAVKALHEVRWGVENQYSRSVAQDGNKAAQQVLKEIFEVCDRSWRGLGNLPQSGLDLRPAYQAYDAALRFPLTEPPAPCQSACIAGEILRGQKRPTECGAFGNLCNPENPLGAPMVSSEGACAAYYRYRETIMAFSCPLPVSQYPVVTMAHGGGGRMSQRLISELFVEAFQNPLLDQMHDGVVVPMNGRMAFSTDSFVVNPIFFPGGNIGSLAVHGTVNDLAMCGARPTMLSAGFILEEGFPTAELWRIAVSMGQAAKEAGVIIATGDTKVVERGKGDGVYINTSGVGMVPDGVKIRANRVRPGDQVLLSGRIAEHGIAVLSCRQGLEFETPLESDSASLNGLVEVMLEAGADGIHVLRDPTRGGVATVLNEIAQSANLGTVIQEANIPVGPEVAGACELMGFDPLYVANEGKCLAWVDPKVAPKVLEAMRSHPLGQDAVLLGEVVADHPGRVWARSPMGGTRLLDLMSGEQLPRIC